jgi:cytosine/adenosine deaminase-related metal-dependent hydrolase
MDFISGEILTKKGIQNGYIGFQNGLIIEVGNNLCPKKPKAKGLILPKFVNAHTHIGDSFIRNRKIYLPKDLEKLVSPPKGLKHILLNKTSDEEIIDGMKYSINEMIKSGTSYFCDFRENGLHGINQLKKSLEKSNISPIILSRPNHQKYVKDEINILLKNSQGIGLSSISDWEYSEIEKIAKQTKKKKRIFGIHASEGFRENIDKILDLKPDFLIHMNYATQSDLILVKECNIPIIICPRSNAFFGLKLNIENMKKIGINIMLGSDNAMLNKPNILDELIFFKKITKISSIEYLLNMITYNPRKALNLDYDILDLNSTFEFVVIDKNNLKPIYISRNKMEK